jgi:hypothetical protein
MESVSEKIVAAHTGKPESTAHGISARTVALILWNEKAVPRSAVSGWRWLAIAKTHASIASAAKTMISRRERISTTKAFFS